MPPNNAVISVYAVNAANTPFIIECKWDLVDAWDADQLGSVEMRAARDAARTFDLVREAYLRQFNTPDDPAA